ncbi:alginate lyase family protein [Colwellia echini]|nr:alginate lyase family protein [Colwellia echini]
MPFLCNTRVLKTVKLPMLLLNLTLAVIALNIVILNVAMAKSTSTAKPTNFIQYDATSIANVKLSLKNNTAAPYTQKAYKALIKKADSTLKMTNPSVMDKDFFPPSKDKHDYLSLSRYWWPDPKSPDGLPWIRKDGITNPDTQTDHVDRGRLGETMRAIRILSLAYYFSNDEKYAQKGVSLINTWFLDENTKMNPHLEYGQSVPGNPKSRRSGMLDGRVIPENVLDAITIFSNSPAWTATQDTQMTAWLTQYLTWLTTSELGKSGASQKNNHGSWYHFQVAALAWYLADDALLKQSIIAAQQSFPEQFDAQGAQQHELARTRAFFYSCFNLQALALIANIAEKSNLATANLSLWQYQSPTGQSLQLATDYLMPVTREEKWPHASKNLDQSQLSPILSSLVMYANKPEYQATLSKIIKDLTKNKKLTSNQKRTYYEFVLLTPQLLTP